MKTSEGTTVFLTTHNLFEADQICDQVGIIRQGTLLASGPPDLLGAPDATAGGSALEKAYLQIMSRNRIAKETP